MPEKCSRDPRDVLVQEKYYTHLPDPLLDWLIRARIPDSAKRVFLAHWRAGHINGDWCSEIPLKTLAAQCQLDISTITRAYQLLSRHGLIRREDPGRDPSRPFQQAVAITEVRLPRELVLNLDQYPNRRKKDVQNSGPAEPDESGAPQTAPVARAPTPPLADPFDGLSLRARTQALNSLLERMSAPERTQYHDAVRLFQTTIIFDRGSKLSVQEQRTVLQLLSRMAKSFPESPAAPRHEASPRQSERQPRRLSSLEVARLRRDLQSARGTSDLDGLLREVLWSVEEGALSRFAPLHATRIALKKIRGGEWSRPNKMPPQWARNLSRPAPVVRTGAGDSWQVRGASRSSTELARARTGDPENYSPPVPRPATSRPLPIASLLSARQPIGPVRA